jgi:hypothetical protein
VDSDESSDGDDQIPINSKSAGNNKSTLNLQSDQDILQQLYGNGEKNLGKSDEFLRNYILSEGWKDKSNKDEDHYAKYKEENERVDNEDEERDLEMDVYEHNHNFRFE